MSWEGWQHHHRLIWCLTGQTPYYDYSRQRKISDNLPKNGGYSAVHSGAPLPLVVEGGEEGERARDEVETFSIPAWPCYPHPLTKPLGRAFHPGQLSMDKLTSAELPLLYTFSLPWQKGSTSTPTKSHQALLCGKWISEWGLCGVPQALAWHVFLCHITTSLTENRLACLWTGTAHTFLCKMKLHWAIC